ncbi:MAG TPA: hypothetical protein VFB62_09025, partial [Polyangiaceae bacterium]|nr:hypothetical protein [Polyangiaceae bacterium]
MKQFLFACVTLALFVGCDDDETSNPTTTTTTSAVGGNGSGGSGSGATGPGAGGGGASVCLPASEHEAIFTIADPSLCVVATYRAALRVGLDPNTFQSIVPSWGRHDGPLTMEQTFDNGTPQNEIVLSRWMVPGSGGDFGDPMIEGPIAPSATATNPFINPVAADLPFSNWTAVGWASFGQSDGEAIMLSGTTVAQRFSVAGLYAMAGTNPRIFHASLTGFEDAMATPSAGVYATDICGMAPCAASILLHAQGDASGPVALDQDDNLFALLPDIALGEQALRAWEASSIAPQRAAQAGDELATLPGSGSSLAAIAPIEGSAGYVFMQPFDGTTFELGDVMRQRYRIEGTTVVAEGALAVALTLTTA